MCLLQPQHSSPSASSFDSFSHRIRLPLPSDSSPLATAFDSLSHCSRLIRLMHSSPSATAFDSFCNRIRLLRSLHSTPSVTAFDSFSHRSRMCQLNEVDEVVKWSGWVRIMKFMISAQLSIHRNGKVKRSLFLLFLILLPTSVKFLTKSGYFSLFNSEIEWNIRENL